MLLLVMSSFGGLDRSLPAPTHVHSSSCVSLGYMYSGRIFPTCWFNPHLAGLQEQQGRGLLQHGCKHYRRRCKLVAPCCGEVFWCRHCHNEVKAANEWVSHCRQLVPTFLSVGTS